MFYPYRGKFYSMRKNEIFSICYLGLAVGSDLLSTKVLTKLVVKNNSDFKMLRVGQKKNV